MATLSDLKTKIKNDLDLNAEDFVTAIELRDYIREGVKAAEAIIHTLYEGYFRDSETLTFVASTQAYSLPSDIYANKILNILYDDGGTKKYKLRRIRRDEEILDIESTDQFFQYDFTNDATAGRQLVFHPTPTVNETSITIWYIRKAKVLTSDSDVLDIPEFEDYVIQYAKNRIYEKEGNPRIQKGVPDLAKLESEMISTLQKMIPDDQNEILPDFSHYDDFDAAGIDYY